MTTEPDFVLFPRQKGTESEYDNIQIFIEKEKCSSKEK